jgi:GNAT superfamily N-acetyltransferase
MQAITQLEVREPRMQEEWDAYYDLRWRILREPWHQPRGSERDEYEADAVHVIALCGRKLAGVGRAHLNSAGEAQIRYMAVEPESQGRGIGGAMLQKLESRAVEKGARVFVLNARDVAVPFYTKHGYVVDGPAESLFECIPHWRMSKHL